MATLIPRSQIIIPPNRQREAVSIEAIADLKASFEEIGLINPITVREDSPGAFTLIAGENRLRTLDQCWAEGMIVHHRGIPIPAGMVPATPWGDLTPLQRFTIELHENVKRKPLTWKEESAAYAQMAALKRVAGIAPARLLVETKQAMDAIAPTAVRNLSEVHQNLLLADHLDDVDVSKARTRGDALKIVARKLQKASDSLARSAALPAGLIHGEAIAELANFPSGYFDAIVSDPPYGCGITQMSHQNASEQEYNDSYENWRVLMNALAGQLARVLKPDAAGFLFCDFSRFLELQTILERAGFETFPRPFIWDRTPDGRLTTPEKWPRRCYECILFFRRGNRPLREIRGDVLSYPANRDSANYHGAKKPVELYLDLLERLVGPGDTVVDPFAGSGPIVLAGRRLSLSITAIEQSEAYFNLMLRLTTPQEPNHDAN